MRSFTYGLKRTEADARSIATMEAIAAGVGTKIFMDSFGFVGCGRAGFSVDLGVLGGQHGGVEERVLGFFLAVELQTLHLLQGCGVRGVGGQVVKFPQMPRKSYSFQRF